MTERNDELMLMENDTIILYEADFPDYYVDKHHPEDYIPVSKPFTQLIYHDTNEHNRLILRITIKTSNNGYLPVSFICDTGATVGIYTNQLLHRLINHRIIKDNDSGRDYIIVGGNKITVKHTPPPHQDCNVIGLRALCIFGLVLNSNYSFGFINLPEFF